MVQDRPVCRGVLIRGVLHEGVHQVSNRLRRVPGVHEHQRAQRRGDTAARVSRCDRFEQLQGDLRMPEIAVCRGRLQLGAVPVWLAQAVVQGAVIERDRPGPVCGGIDRTGPLVGQPWVRRVGCRQPTGSRDPLAGIGEGPDRGDVVLGLVHAARCDDLAADRPRVVHGATPLRNEVGDLGPLDVTHQPDDVTALGRGQQGGQGLDLGEEARDLRHA